MLGVNSTQNMPTKSTLLMRNKYFFALMSLPKDDNIVGIRLVNIQIDIAKYVTINYSK